MEARGVVENRAAYDEFVRTGHFEEGLEPARHRFLCAHEQVLEGMASGSAAPAIVLFLY
jgi:hypothetical protein